MLDRVPYVGKAAVAARQEVGRAKGCPFRVVGFRATVGNPEELLEGSFLSRLYSRAAPRGRFLSTVDVVRLQRESSLRL